MDARPLFESVAQREYDALAKLFAINARNAVLSFLSMRRRWRNSGTFNGFPVRAGLATTPLELVCFSSLCSRVTLHALHALSIVLPRLALTLLSRRETGRLRIAVTARHDDFTSP